MNLPFSTLLLLTGLLSTAASGDGGGGPGTGTEDGGEYRAVLQSPNGAEAAAGIELPGPGVQPVTAGAGQLFSQAAGTTTRIVLVSNPAGPLSFRITMAPGQAP